MKREWLLGANLILPEGIKRGGVLICGGIIEAVEFGENPIETNENITLTDLGGRYLSPGFVELHSHGAGGADFMDNTPEAFLQAARTHLEHGVTTLLPTSVAAGTKTLTDFLAAYKQAESRASDVARMPGVHLEGPYLAPEMAGAIDPRYISNPDPGEYEKLLEFADGDILRWTAAPELPGAEAFCDTLMKRGILPSIGHTNAEYSQIKEAYNRGFTHFTHLYSAMSTITRRSGFRITGALESAYILEDATVEIIADGCHLPLELLYFVYRTKGSGRVCLITDSMRAAGTDVTRSVLGSLGDGLPVIIEDDVAKLPDKTAFAGSIATSDRLLRTALAAGIPLHEAVRMMSLTPACIIGQGGETGSITPGKKADFAVFNSEIQIDAVMLDGDWKINKL